ncbi:MAG TPA: rhodanese-like domain-containing protein [Candidatus Acidoferrales bacterium]|nr:rhodanese-like domain-containing protein [Candidatus Acidoferrales bacterium]
MFHLVSADWVEQRLDSPEFLFLDPRSPIRYMTSHLKNAVNLPVAKQRGANGRLLPSDELARRLGSVGLDTQHTPVLYDNSDGRNAALLAWILAYLGRDDVHIMETFWETWVADKRDVFYRPVQPTPRAFTAHLRSEFRASADDVQKNRTARLLDLRTPDEFSGHFEHDARPGRIPGAANLPCDQIGVNGNILRSPEQLDELFASHGIVRDSQTIAYCRTGLRAALGFLALTQLGRPVSLYDGSYSEWSAAGLPVENDLEKNERTNQKGESAHV